MGRTGLWWVWSSWLDAVELTRYAARTRRPKYIDTIQSVTSLTSHGESSVLYVKPCLSSAGLLGRTPWPLLQSTFLRRTVTGEATPLQ
jgi:hypothetical protein